MKNNKYLSITIIIFIIIILFLVVSFTKDVRRLSREGIFFHRHNLNFRSSTHLFSDISLISGWMTFSYINKSFNLPYEYLKTELNIHTTSYPNITISKVAIEQGVPLNLYIEKLKNIVSMYFITPQPSQ